jgi:hypothetical protein
VCLLCFLPSPQALCAAGLEKLSESWWPASEAGVSRSKSSAMAMRASLLAVPCVGGPGGGSAESQWKDTMVDCTWKDEEMQKMVRDARDEELHGATNQGRVYVVITQGKYVQTSAQARALGRDPRRLNWSEAFSRA